MFDIEASEKVTRNHFIDNNFAYDPSGCTAVAALVTDEDEIVVVRYSR